MPGRAGKKILCSLMDRPNTFGIVGGYGATGTVVAAELLKSCDGSILIGGRDLNKATAEANKLGTQGSAAQLDVFDDHSLDDFCRRCPIVINCAGPVMTLQDRVAQAALRARSHYIDVAGLALVKERLLPHAGHIAELGLSFVVSAGWMPGITELLPMYAHTQARSRMETIESLSIYFADSGEWSENALRDAVWYIHREGLRSPGYFSRGEWKRVKLTAGTKQLSLGDPVGSGRFALVASPELAEVGRELVDCDVYAYSFLSGFRTVLAAMLIGLVPLPRGFGVRLMRNIFRRNRFPVDGFVIAEAVGRSQTGRCRLTAQIVYNDRRDYWINGVVPATVACMMARGKSVRPGLRYLVDAIDPIALMAELQEAGVGLKEKFEALN